jgi:hypothetical protein
VALVAAGVSGSFSDRPSATIPVPFDDCRLGAGAPVWPRVRTSSPPLQGLMTGGTRFDGTASHLAAVGDSKVGLRILDPLYAIVGMPSQPSWSPAAERPALQRILVGLRLVVPF